MEKQTIKNLSSNYIGSFLVTGLGFFIIPFLLKKLGMEGYGLMVLAESLIAIAQIFIFAVRIALSRYATIAVAQKKDDDFVAYLATGRKILLYMMGGVLAAGVLVAVFFPAIFNVPGVLHMQSRWLFFLIVTAFVISIPNIIYWSILYAHLRFDLINIAEYGGGIIRVLGVFVLFTFLPAGYANLITYGLIYFAMVAAQNFFIYSWARMIAPGLNLRGARFDRDKAREIISYGGYTSVGNMSPALYENVLNILINVFVGPGANAMYAIGMKLPNIMKRIILQPSWSLIPTFTDLVARGERKATQSMFLGFSKSVSLILTPLSFVLIFFAGPIIHLWVGSGFEEASRIMVLLVISMLFSMSGYFSTSIYNAYGTIKVPTSASLILTIGSLLLGAFLCFDRGRGLVGFAEAAVIISVFGAFIFTGAYTCWVAGLSVWRYWFETFIKPLILTGLVLMPVLIFFQQRILLCAFLVVFLVIPVYFALAYRYVLTRDEQEYLKGMLRKIRGKL